MGMKTCILCPKGCQIYMEQVDGIWSFHGNQCNQGKTFLLEELKEPKRILTTTVKIQISEAEVSRLAIRSKEAISKELLMKAMKVAKEVKVQSPIAIGDIVYENILGTGVDFIASQSK